MKKIKPSNFSLTDLSLKWILSHPEVTVVIPGAKNKIQAELNVKASELNEINSIKDNIKEIYNKYFKKIFIIIGKYIIINNLEYLSYMIENFNGIFNLFLIYFNITSFCSLYF